MRTSGYRSRSRLGLVMCVLAVGCADGADGDGDGDNLSFVSEALTAAYCQIPVDGIGTIDMETNYLPHVIACENGGANIEALKAQAIAARSVAYYTMQKSGHICDGQKCQVYSCGAQPSAIHYQAVQDTSGMYLSYAGKVTYGFYVAGDSATSGPSCVGRPWIGTEGYVTYNQAKWSTQITQTSLGLISPPGSSAYGQNRGCMSQWGARCLEADRHFNYRDILRFYYGEDIQILQASGSCVASVPAPTACECDQGYYHNGDRIPITATYCGQRVCGGGNAVYECTQGGWAPVAGLSCGFGGCACSGGTDYKGNPIATAHTECNVRACGLNFEFYTCGGGGWQPTGETCPLDQSGSACRCENGIDGAGNPIDPDDTFCGFETCGVNGQQWRCTAGGWSLVSTTCGL